MALHVRKNQYRGVNAHLHSVLQHETAGWEGLHTKHIADLTAELSAQLPDGYIADLEQSLQIRQFHPDTGEEITLKPRRGLRPDLLISHIESVLRPTGMALLEDAAAPTLTLSALESIDYDPRTYLSAIVIRRTDNEDTTPVTWIEVLSPTNKAQGTGAAQYEEKRIKVLQSGLVLVEIDYLHETLSPISKLPSYPDREPNAYPYTIAVTDPRPTLQTGTLRVYGFRVDEPIPTIPIPLALGDKPVRINLDKVYQQSFEGVSAFSYRVDYEQLPPAFETYDDTDQQRIRVRMQAVIEGVKGG
jgi:hypothetical protein